ERETVPGAVDLAPMAGRGPAFGADRGPAVRQPQFGPLIAAVAHESEPVTVAHQAAGDTYRPHQRAMRGGLVVETEILGLMPNGVDAFGQCAQPVSVA